MVYIQTESEVLMYRGKKNAENVLKYIIWNLFCWWMKQKINQVKGGQI